VLIAVGKMIRDPRDDGPKEDRQADGALRHWLWQIARLLVDVMPHIHHPTV
jgi:hypothetical protein